MKVLLAIGLGIVLSVLTAAVVLDRTGQRPAPSGAWDLIVVPGALVWMVDGQPEASPALKRRVATAVALWKAQLAPRLVFTGAGTTAVPLSQAAAAARYAVQELGVAPDAILLEERSTSTLENAAFAAALYPAARVIVVADYYHAFRCQRVFGRAYGPMSEIAVVGTRPSNRVRIRGVFRELPALLLYLLRGQL